MAFGINPKYVQEIPLETLSSEDFMALALESAERCGWQIGYVSAEGFKAYVKLSLSSWNEEITLHIIGEVASIKSECTGRQLADLGKNKKNIQNFLSFFGELKNTVDKEPLQLKYQSLKERFATERPDDLYTAQKKTKASLNDFLSIFKPVEGYFITPLLINLNIILFVLMCATGVNIILPDDESLLSWGGNYKPSTLDGQWWRLITCAFLHIGVIHLLFNMYALIYIGMLLEPLLGKWKFLLAYLLTAITSSITSLWWHDNTISAGASGAIFGMYGVFLALLTTNLIEKAERNNQLSSMLVFVGYNLLFGLQSGIDNAGHIGGLTGGLFLGYGIYFILVRPASGIIRNAVLGGGTLIILVFATAVYLNVSNPVGLYQDALKIFGRNETKALEYFDIPETAPDNVYVLKLTEGIRLWHENTVLLNALNSVDLPDALKEHVTLLKSYSRLRESSYQLLLEATQKPGSVSEAAIEKSSQDIQQIIKRIQALN